MIEHKYVAIKLTESEQIKFGHKYTIESDEDNFFADSSDHALELEQFLNSLDVIEKQGLKAIATKYAS